MTLSQALGVALTTDAVPGDGSVLPGDGPADPGSPSGRPARPEDYGLTPREGEVLQLVATGMSDAQIGERLVISPRTVGKHLQSIYSKLYVPSRSAATRWALEHGLG